MKRGHLIDDYHDDMSSDDYLNYFDSYGDEEEEQYNENGGENCVGFFELMENQAIYAEATEDDMLITRDKERQRLDGCWRHVKKENSREWVKANIEDHRESVKVYYDENKEEILKKRNLKHSKNASEINEQRRAKYSENIQKEREAAKERMKKYRQKLKEQQQ